MPRLSARAQGSIGVLVSVISLTAVAIWVSRQDAPHLPDDASGWAWLVVAVFVYALSLGLRGLRWHRIMVLADMPHRRGDAYGLTLVGYMGNNVLPARGGELLRIGILGARTTARRREVLGSILAERALDASVLTALFAVFTWAGIAGAPAGQWPAAVAAALLVGAAAALAVYLALRRRGWFERFAHTVRPVARALKIFASPHGAPLGILTAAVWWLEGAVLLCVSRSLGLELSIADAVLVIVLASLAATLPAAPGYAGTFDAGLVLGLNAAGIDGGAAVGFIVLARFVMFVPVTLAGLGVLITRYGGLRRGRRLADPHAPEVVADELSPAGRRAAI